MRFIIFTMVLYVTLASLPQAQAGKVDDVQVAVKKYCGKDIPDDEALRMVKSLFLSCVPGSKIEINGCQVGCLKLNAGAVVGQ